MGRAETSAEQTELELMGRESMIPILPCEDADQVVAFYETLGFALHHRQTKPYPYLAFSWREVSLHFGRIPPGVEREREDFACLIVVDEVAAYHAYFASRLRAALGRVPASGRPRLTRLRPGATRFTLVDPEGNNLIFVRRNEPKNLEYGGSPDLSGLAKALDNARILRDYREDHRAAFRALDSALRRPKPGDLRSDRATALAWMIELASGADRSERIPDLLGEVREMQLADDEFEAAVSAVADTKALRALRALRS